MIRPHRRECIRKNEGRLNHHQDRANQEKPTKLSHQPWEPRFMVKKHHKRSKLARFRRCVCIVGKPGSYRLLVNGKLAAALKIAPNAISTAATATPSTSAR